MDQSYVPANVFPTPPMHHHSVHSESSPESYQHDYGQQDLADILGALKVDEAGTGRLCSGTWERMTLIDKSPVSK